MTRIGLFENGTNTKGVEKNVKYLKRSVNSLLAFLNTGPKREKSWIIPKESKVLNILLVEDNELLRRVCSRLLKKAGHDVTCAGNGKVAVDEIYRREYDVVLMGKRIIHYYHWYQLYYVMTFRYPNASDGWFYSDIESSRDGRERRNRSKASYDDICIDSACTGRRY